MKLISLSITSVSSPVPPLPPSDPPQTSSPSPLPLWLSPPIWLVFQLSPSTIPLIILLLLPPIPLVM